MKFTDGFWLMKKGVTPYFLAEVRDVKIQDNALTVYVAHRPVENRGNTLDCPLFILKYTSPRPDVLRAQIWHFKGQPDKGPHFEINTAPVFSQIADEGDAITFTTGRTQLRLEKKPFAARFYYDGKLMTQSAQRHFAYINTYDEQSFMREQLGLSVGECVYGLGERFTHFVKNGQTVDIWNEDGGTASEISYKNIPFYLSNRGYGVLVNHAEKVSFEVGSEAVSRVQFSVSGHMLDYFIIGGDCPKTALTNYTALIGRPELPPAWSFGLWLTTSFTTNYDEQTVNSFIDGMAQRDIPLRVFHFDCFWMKEYEWCNFEWDGEVFPDPEGMIRRLHEKGLKVCAWINPYISQKSALFDEGMAEGYLIKNKDGGVWQTDKWQTGMGLVDFTNPAAVKWYCGYLRKLLKMGVDCFKTDFGERIPADGVYFDGSDPLKMHNYYTFLYNKAVHDLLVKEKGESVLFARSATVGGQQFPVHWGGDCSSNFESMAESLRGGLSLLSSGFGFWSHDMSGFEQTATPDVYKRWGAFGLLSSHSRLHGSSSYRVPWLFDEESVDVIRHFSRLKCRLMPYLYEAAVQTAETGVPTMRPMPIEFPADRGCDYLDRQYMLGANVLVAPVFTPEGAADYYLPQGKWTHLLSNEVKCGGWHRDTYDYFSLPLFVRENTILPLGANDHMPDYDYADGLELHLFALKEGVPAAARVCDLRGKEFLRVEAVLQNGCVSVKWQGKTKGMKLVLRNVAQVKDTQSGTCEAGEQGAVITVAEGAREVLIAL